MLVMIAREVLIAQIALDYTGLSFRQLINDLPSQRDLDLVIA